MDTVYPDVSMEEVVSLAALDYRLFCSTFFPKTFRDPFPPFADRIWNPLESAKARLVNLQLFRGSSKTTTLRAFIAKRIAYALSRTILYLAASKPKARHTIRWLKAAIERNRRFADTFGLKRGAVWNDDEIEIVHAVAGHSIWITGMGIEGPVRGLLQGDDGYRPDTIIVDDVVDDENSATHEQREKMENLLLGAVAKSLAPRSEAPNSKLAFLQTPFNHEDASMKALLDPMWYNVRQGCWTRASEDSPDQYQMSAWEQRFPTEELRQEKIGYIIRNRASTFAREMEVRLVTAETAAFMRSWITFYRTDELPKTGMYVVIAVDPVPPPTPNQVLKGMHKRDFEAIAAVGYWRGRYFLLEYAMNKGHDPSWTVSTFFDMWRRWRARKLVVETHQYQATLYWLFRQAMIKQRTFIPIEENRDVRSTYSKITDELQGLLQHGQFLVRLDHSEAIAQITDYPNVSHDDLLMAIAMAVKGCMTMELDEEELLDDLGEQVKPLQIEQRCP